MISQAIMTCALAIMQPTHPIPAVVVSHNTEVCQQWERPESRACYAMGVIRAPRNADAFVLAHEYAHHVQLFDQRVRYPLTEDQRRKLEAEAVRVQIECGRV